MHRSNKYRKTNPYNRGNYLRAAGAMAGRPRYWGTKSAFSGRSQNWIPGKNRTSGYYGRYTVGGEKKFHDLNLIDATIATGMTISNLTVIPEGNGESDRIGRKITIKNIHVKYQMTLPTTTTQGSTSDIVRCMIVQDMQTNGVQFAATDLLETDNFLKFRNLANSKRFKILWSKEISIQSGGGGPASTTTTHFAEANRYFKVNKRCHIPIEYDNSATTGVITSVRSNNIYWVTQSKSGHVAGDGELRLRYTDQ